MATFSEIKAGLDEIADRNKQNLNNMDRSRAGLAAAEANLNAMPSTYSTLIGEIDAAATANPTIEAFQVAKSEKDQLVLDFQALKTRATALVAAVDGI
jgi:hypothetical protein